MPDTGSLPSRITVLRSQATLLDRVVAVLSYEEWDDRTVVRWAMPGGPFLFLEGTWSLRRDGETVARRTAAGGGTRSGLNSYDVHFVPPVPYGDGLEMVYVENDEPVGAVPLRQG